MRFSHRTAVVVVVLGLSASPQAQQKPADRPLFRAGVELVQLDVSVLDRDRRPVIGLTAADFKLFENGRPKPIRAFTAIQIPAPVQPVQSPAADPPLPDVTTNRGGHQDGRLVVILMDRSIPPEQPTIAARRIATAAVNALGPHDLAALVSTGGGVPQNLTANRARLIEAINARDWSTDLSKEQEAIIGKQDPLSDGRCLCGLCVLETVTRVADAVQRSPRRHKVLLFIGSRLILQSGPRAPTADVGCERPLEQARRRLQAALAVSHLTVHSIDPTGLSTLAASAGAPGGKPGESRFKRAQDLQSDTIALLQGQGSLQFLPELTGGRVVVNTNAPEAKVPEIFAESSAYYVLAFEPQSPGRSAASTTSGQDATSVEVKVSRPGVRVYAQRKYQVPPPERTAGAKASSPEPTPLMSALRGLLPLSTRPLTLATAAFAGPNTDATVIVNVDVGAFADGETSRPLRFALSAVDPTGREIKSATETATVAFTPGTADGPPEANVQTRLELPPGDYEVRMAIEDAATSTVSSVFSPITVPRFHEVPLSLSDVTIEATGGTPPHVTPADVVLSPTTRRVFSRVEQIRALLQIYQGTRRTEPIVPASVRTRIVDANGRAVRDQQLDLTEKDFVNRIAGMAMDLSGLPAGSYVLTIDATTDQQPARRAVPFAVR